VPPTASTLNNSILFKQHESVVFKCVLIVFVLLLSGISCLTARSYSFTLNVKNVPAGKKNVLIILRYFGEDFLPSDSFHIHQDTTFIIELKDFSNGLYALKWKSERQNQAELLMNEDEKNLKIEADYTQLLNGSIMIENSKENTAYAQLIQTKMKYEPQFYETAVKLSSISFLQPDYKSALMKAEEEMELKQNLFNLELQQIELAYPNTFTTQVLLPLARFPVRNMQPEWEKRYDGYRSFLHENFFHFINTNDTRLLYHYAFLDKINEYFNSYTDKSTDGAKAGIDVLMKALKSNDEVNNFVYNYLLKVFIKGKSDMLIQHLMSKHPSGCTLKLSADDLKKLMSIQATSLGGQAPDLLLYDQHGKVQSLYEQCKKNKITLLIFWTSWCSRCQKEMPVVEALLQKYRKSGLGLFAVSLDEKKEEWIKAINLFKLSGVHVSELLPLKQSKILPMYNISTTPALFLLDSESKIMAKNIFGYQLEEFIKTKLK
jgi:thiol-disulfide isomerase/thioredoxin